jgi:hypothetical protein
MPTPKIPYQHHANLKRKILNLDNCTCIDLCLVQVIKSRIPGLHQKCFERGIWGEVVEGCPKVMVKDSEGQPAAVASTGRRHRRAPISLADVAATCCKRGLPRKLLNRYMTGHC